jgi:hypothetical protein
LEPSVLEIQVIAQRSQIGRENGASGIAGAFAPPLGEKVAATALRFEQKRLTGRCINFDNANQNGMEIHTESLYTASRKPAAWRQSKLARGCHIKGFVVFTAAG